MKNLQDIIDPYTRKNHKKSFKWFKEFIKEQEKCNDIAANLAQEMAIADEEYGNGYWDGYLMRGREVTGDFYCPCVGTCHKEKSPCSFSCLSHHHLWREGLRE